LSILPILLGLVIVLNVVLLLWLVLHQWSGGSQAAGIKRLVEQTEGLQKSLTQQFATATADMASRLEQTKGDLRQQVSDRLADGFSSLRGAVEDQMKAGRQEQAERLGDARKELTGSLALTTSALKSEFDRLNQQTAESLESIRERVDAKLLAITEQVQTKLDQNIKEGFAQFEKVQQHLRAATRSRRARALDQRSKQFAEAAAFARPVWRSQSGTLAFGFSAGAHVRAAMHRQWRRAGGCDDQFPRSSLAD